MELSHTATMDEIKSAYKKLAKKFHPDLNNGEAFYIERLKQINHAYSILSDPEKRAKYDLDGEEK